MYTQQYRQPPKDYGGTALPKQPEITQKEAAPEDTAPVLKPSFSSDQILIAVIIMMVLGGGEKNTLLIMALVFILL